MPLIKKTGSDASWNYASVVICGFLGVTLTFCVGAYFGPSVLGVFNIVFAFYIILSQVAAFGVHHSVLKHVAEFEHDKVLRRFVFVGGLIGSVPVAFAVSLCLWIFSKPISVAMCSPDMALGLVLAAAGLFFFALNKVLLAALNALSRLKEYAVYMALRYFFMLIALFGLIAIGENGKYVAIILPASEFPLFCVLFFTLIGEMRWDEFSNMRHWVATHLSFGFRAFGGNLMLDLNTRVDVLCLGLFVSDKAVGVYSMAAILAEAAYQIPVVLRTVYNPKVIQMLARRSYESLQGLINKTRISVWIGMSFIALIGVVVYPYIIPLISGYPEYAKGTIAFGIIMTGMVVASGYVPFGMILANAGYPGLQTGMIIMLLLINFGGNFLLIPFLGSLGAALATAITHVFSLFLLKGFCKKFLCLRI